jgi:hypothetical protein
MLPPNVHSEAETSGRAARASEDPQQGSGGTIGSGSGDASRIWVNKTCALNALQN